MDDRLSDAEFVKQILAWANDIMSAENSEPSGPSVIEVTPTGRAYAASHEFRVIFPDGSTTTVWSPPWGDVVEQYSPEWELMGARCYAQGLWEGRKKDENDL